MKQIVCDSSTLISLADTCNISCLKFLEQRSQARFLIPPGVRGEIISCPINIPQFEFSAVRLSKILHDGVISLYSAPDLQQRTHAILAAANNVFRLDNRPLELVHAGEAECLAVYAGAKASALAIDEKTTRLFVEDPNKLLEIIRSEYAGKLSIDARALDEFRRLTGPIFVMRSSEIIAAASLKGFFADYGDFEDEAFHAALNALRRAGCSLPTQEVKDYASVRLGNSAGTQGKKQ